MKKYLFIGLMLCSIYGYADTNTANHQTSNTNDNNLLVQLVDTKLANMEDKLARVEKANQDSITEVKSSVDDKLADKFKQLDDRAGDIDHWFTVIGWIWLIFGVVAPLLWSALLNRKVKENIKTSKEELDRFTKDASDKINEQLDYGERILALIKENHSRSKQLTKEQEEMRINPPYEVNDTNKDDVAAISQAAREKPENQLTAKDWFIRGLDAADKQEYYEAITYYGKAIKLSDSAGLKSFAYNNSGNAKSKLNNYNEAIQDYDEAIRFNPRDGDYYNNRGTAKYNLGKYEEAIQDYDEGIKLNPQKAGYYNNRGIVKYNLGKYEEAIQDYDEAIKLNPENDNAYSNRGNAKGSLGKYEEAILDHDEAIKLNPRNDGAYSNRGTVKLKLYKYEEAIGDFDKAIEINPQFAGAFFNKGCVYALTRNKPAALQSLDEALKLGYDVDKVLADSDWYEYLNDADFKALINKYNKDNNAKQD